MCSKFGCHCLAPSFTCVLRVLSVLYVEVFVVVMKDIRRLRQVLVGMQLALAAYPGAWLLAVIAATLKCKTLQCSMMDIQTACGNTVSSTQPCLHANNVILFSMN